MRQLIVVGAGGHGREVAFTHLLQRQDAAFLGFLDDNQEGDTPEGWPVLGPPERWIDHQDCQFVIAVNAPRVRRSIVQRMTAMEQPQWGTIVHPSVDMHANCVLGAGSMILGGVDMTVNITLGSHCIVNRGAAIGHDTSVGSFCTLSPLASLSGCISAGDGVEVGTGAAVRQGLLLDKGCMVGMGSVVLNDVPANTVVVGNPAKPLDQLESW